MQNKNIPHGQSDIKFWSLRKTFKRFQQADTENEQRRRLEQAAAQADTIDPNKAKIMQKKQQVCFSQIYFISLKLSVRIKHFYHQPEPVFKKQK